MKLIQAQRWEAQEKIIEDRSVLDKSISLIEEKTTVSKHLDSKIIHLDTEKSQYTEQQIEIDKELNKKSESVTKISAELESLRNELDKNEALSSSLEIEKNAQRSELNSLLSKLTFLKSS